MWHFCTEKMVCSHFKTKNSWLSIQPKAILVQNGVQSFKKYYQFHNKSIGACILHTNITMLGLYFYDKNLMLWYLEKPGLLTFIFRTRLILLRLSLMFIQSIINLSEHHTTLPQSLKLIFTEKWCVAIYHWTNINSASEFHTLRFCTEVPYCLGLIFMLKR